MYKDHFIHIFKYNDWATTEAAESIVNLKKTNDRIYELLSHIISSQRIWLNRVLRNSIVIEPWKKYSPERCIELSIEITSEWINFLESLEEERLNERIKYKNNKGEDWENTVGDIITHVINHSTYHRAQIAQLIRQSGGTPAKTDYIAYQKQFQI